MKKVDLIIIFLILSLAFILRLYKINTPLADYHSWRQVDTAAVARNFVKSGFDLMKPRYDDLSSIETGKENPQGYRFVEFPLYNAIFAYLYKLYPSLPLEVYGRLTSAFFSLLVIYSIYYLCLKEASRLAAIAAATLYAVFPFFVFFSRVILPETAALAFMMLSVVSLYVWQKTKKRLLSNTIFFLSSIFFGLSLLIKPTTIFYSIPLLYIFYNKYRFSLPKKFSFYFFFVISVIPMLLWRLYIKQYPEGIPANTWLINQVNTYQGLKDIFFRPAFFRWIFFERLNNNMLGGYLAFFLLLGVFIKQKSKLFYGFLAAALSYLFVFQGGNVQHEYYQTLIMPTVAIFIGLGINHLLINSKEFVAKPVIIFATLVFVGLSFFFSFYKVREFYNYPIELPQIASVISSLTEKNDKIITDRLGDTTLLYLTNRRGSPALYKDLVEFKNDGYSYFVTLNKEKIEEVKKMKEYAVVFENDQFALFKL